MSSPFVAQSASMYSRVASRTARHLSRESSLFQSAQNTSSNGSERSRRQARERAFAISSSSAGEYAASTSSTPLSWSKQLRTTAKKSSSRQSSL